MSLLEWLKIWCKFYIIPLFCNTECPPPPRKLEFRQILGLWVFSITDNPPPRKLEFRQILGLWVFSITEYPPPENWNLSRSWDFGYFNYRIPPPPRRLEFRQILGLWVFSITEYPPPDLGTFLVHIHTHTHIPCHLVCIVGEIILHSG